MALTDYRADAMRCTRCCYCKWIPFDLVKSHRFAKGCPSVEAGNFHSYSAGGRLVTALSLMDGRSEVTDQVVDIAFKCQLCGNCDVACKLCRYDMEPLARAARVPRAPRGDGPRARVLPPADRADAGGDSPARAEDAGRAQRLGRGARPQGPGRRAGRRRLLRRLQVLARGEPARDGAHAGARAPGRRPHRRPVAENGCCGGLAYNMGYRDESAEAGSQDARSSGRPPASRPSSRPAPTATTRSSASIPSSTARRRHAEVLHTVECVDRLIKDGRLELTTPVPMTVTYHDPCNLGRQGEPYVPWDGVETKIYGQAVVYDPPRPALQRRPRRLRAAARRARRHPRRRARRDGAQPRGRLVLRRRRRLPRGLSPSTRPATAAERVEEAASTGAEALVTACSRCELNFAEAVAADAASGGPGADLKVHDVLELVALSAGSEGGS